MQVFGQIYTSPRILTFFLKNLQRYEKRIDRSTALICLVNAPEEI